MSLDAVRSKCMSCEECPLCKTRHNVVFGEGVVSAPIMLIGEGPGENEDLQGRPFVGNAGKFLDDMLSIIDLDRGKNYYITNVIKCRPPKNRDPLPEEKESCRRWLHEQIRILDPKIILCLGRIAARELIDSDFHISTDHGKVYEREGRYYIATYHPSALLRDPSRRPDAFYDLKQLQALINDHCPEAVR